MKETILQFHGDMERAIARLEDEATGTVRTEKCFQIAADYWLLAKQHIRQTGFPDDAAEIDFFKNQKATFTGSLEYYLLLYRYYVHADAGREVVEQFRREEAARILKFRDTHAIFIDYYETARTEWDKDYFLRRKFHKMQRPPSQVYDRATDFWTNGDWILTLLHANRRFEQFLETSKTSLKEK
jgi:RteC protein